MINAKQEIDKLRKLIKYHNKKYYVESDSVISDEEYDKLFRKLQTLEKQYPELITKNSPTQTVGAKASKTFKTAKHTVPMLSLKTETDYTQAGVDNFITRLSQELGANDMAFVSYVAEPKYDGLGLDITYSNGSLTLALTRGDGDTGEVVTENAKMIQCVPALIKSHDRLPINHLQLRGEVVMSKYSFNEVNQALLKKGYKTYVNPRNAASGALRQLDPLVTKSRKLSFYAYSLISVKPDRNFKSHSEQLSFLESLGFTLSEEIRKAQNAEDLKQYHEKLYSIRKDLPYEIDGVVYKVDSLDHQKRLGFVSREPKWAVAHKFLAPEEKTKLIAIDVQVGRTGKLTPVARLDPVFVSGTTITNVTLHNVFDLRSRKVRVGDEVYVRRAGDVIPEITGHVQDARMGYYRNFSMPSTCPVCSGPVERQKGSREYRCTNKLSCPAQLIGSITHYASKKAMNIEGLGDRTVECLVNNNLLFNITDIYRLFDKRQELSKLEGFGTKTIENLFGAIQKTRSCSFSKFLYSLGIPNVGENTSKILASRFADLNDLKAASLDELKQIPDIGPICAKSIIGFMSSKGFEVARQLYFSELNIEKNIKIITNKLQGKTFVITGSFAQVDREKLKLEIEKNGGKVSGTVNKNTDYLVAGENAGSKLNKSKELNVKIIDYYFLKGMLE
jgi:DNA ligase (NAD+)